MSPESPETSWREALASPDASVRLHAALAAGARPDPARAALLVERCGVEPDFFVRDMLTWALVQVGAQVAVPLLLAELGSPHPQARSQALHTMTKVHDRRVWPALTTDLLHDSDDEVARAAWRAAAGLAPDAQRPALADELVVELGRGDREVMLSLTRALAALGEAARPAVLEAQGSDDELVAAHAAATLRLLDDPGSDAGYAVDEARRARALRDAPTL